MRDRFDQRSVGGIRGGGGPGGDGILETSETRLDEAKITLSTPRGRFVGRRFRVAGSAFVRMRTHQFIKASGQGKTLNFTHDISKGLLQNHQFQISLRIGDAEVQPDLSVDGDRLRWSHTVENARPGRLRITASMTGTVEETQSKTGAGRPLHHSETVRFSDQAVAEATVDFSGPDVAFTSHTVTVGPPWYAVVEGTSADDAGVQAVHWHLDSGDSGAAENIAHDWTKWRALIALPDRSQSHVITITARDRAGNDGSDDLTIAPDTTPPTLAITRPPENPDRVLWQEGGITVIIEGTAMDDQSRLAGVRWSMDEGDERDAEQTGQNWSTWRIPAEIASPGVHFVSILGRDMSDNLSEPLVLELRVQV